MIGEITPERLRVLRDEITPLMEAQAGEAEALLAAGELEGHASRLADEGKTPMYVGIDGGAAGIVAVADTVKEGSAAAIAASSFSATASRMSG